MSSEDLALKALLEFLNVCESGIAAAKKRIKEAKGLVEWDASKITWQQAEGSKGPYEKSTADTVSNQDNPDFEDMLSDIQAHGDRLSRDGWFYWKFDNSDTMGRKKRK